MPIYEYQCGSCEHRLEKIQKISDEPLTTCPECKESSLTKMVSAPGFRLKGQGWYETDFKGNNNNSTNSNNRNSNSNDANKNASASSNN